MMNKRKLVIGMYDTSKLWTLASLKLTPAEQQTNYITVRGRSGALDLSTAVTGGIPVYGNRTLTAVLELSENTREQRERYINDIINQLDGVRAKIQLPDDPGWYLDGRVHVAREYNDLAHAAVSIKADCYPYKLKTAETTVVTQIAGVDSVVKLTCTRRPIVPTITVDAETVITWYGASYSVSPGKHRISGILLTMGTHTMKARTTGGEKGNLTITYQEGQL